MNKTDMLKKNYEFRMVFTKGKYYTGKYIEAFSIKNKIKKNKIGIAIGKKGLNAVKRNYLKRLIRESYRMYEKEFEGGNSIVFLVKRKANIDEITFDKVCKDMEKILKEIDREK